ncbi:MAG: AraC family transcriptional regulator [Bacillota bacterium]
MYNIDFIARNGYACHMEITGTHVAIFRPQTVSLGHSHEDEYEFHYFFDSDGKFTDSRKTYPIAPGYIFFSRPRENHEFVLTGKKPTLFFCYLRFKIDAGEKELLDSVGRRFSLQGFLKIGVHYRYLFEEIVRKFNSGQADLKNAAAHKLHAFLYELSANTPPRDERLEKALGLMQQNLSSPIDLDKVIREVGLNKSYFIRFFKSKMGITPVKYMIKLRMDTACYLLAQTDLPVYRIAEQLQFYDEFYFSKKFKEYMGVAPKEYRKKMG